MTIKMKCDPFIGKLDIILNLETIVNLFYIKFKY